MGYMKLSMYIVVLLLVLLYSFPSAFASVFNTNLTLGSRGSEVKKMHDFLSSQGLLVGSSTTYFGQQSKKSVQLFQKKNNIPVSGSWFFATRQKANAIVQASNQVEASTGTPMSLAISSIKVANPTNTTIAATKNVTLTVKTVGYGYVLSPDYGFTCYDNDSCTKNILRNNSITLTATPKEGYVVQGWSEAQCGTSLTCTVKMIEDTTVYARFEVKKLFKPTGTIARNHPNDVCYIQFGEDVCHLRFTWTNNSGLDMTIKSDEDEYYLSVKDHLNSGWQTSDFDPDDVAKAEAENVSGPVYFDLFQGTHKMTLKSHDQILDTVIVDVKCVPGTVWDGTKCWEKDAKRLYIFKTQGGVVKSEPSRLNCGYNPEVCTVGFSNNSKVVLTASVLPGYTFSGWYGDCSGIDKTCILQMDKDKTVGLYVSGSARSMTELLPATSSLTSTPVAGCIPNWKCDGWGKCLGLTLKRSCYDLNACNSLVNKPTTQVRCEPQTSTLR